MCELYEEVSFPYDMSATKEREQLLHFKALSVPFHSYYIETVALLFLTTVLNNLYLDDRIGRCLLKRHTVYDRSIGLEKHQELA